MKKEELINAFMEFVGEKFPELIEEQGNGFSEGERCYFLTQIGEVITDTWTDHEIDKSRISIGNCFKSEEEAEFAVERLKVIHELSELTRPFIYESDSWCFYLNSEGEFDYYAVYETRYLYGDYYFDTKEEAQRAIDQIGEDRIKKYLFGVEG